MFGTALTTMYAGWAAVQILALNPLAAVPAHSLAQIHHDLRIAGESLGTLSVVAVLTIGVGLAAASLVFTLTHRGMTVRAVAAIYLVLLSFGAIAYVTASFGAGVALADTYGISGRDAGLGAVPLYTTSGLALLAVLTQAVTTVRSARPQLRLSPT